MLDIYIAELASWIAYVGVAIVLLGVMVTLYRFAAFLATGFDDEKALMLRHSLMLFLSIGLDFLIAKDIIVTLSLEQSDYYGLIQLGVIILIRILLSYFVYLEEKVIHLYKGKGGKKRK